VRGRGEPVNRCRDDGAPKSSDASTPETHH
jgi:hypothetical protein